MTLEGAPFEPLTFYRPVRPDIMRLAIRAFYAALQRYPAGDRKRFKKAEARVFKAVKADEVNQLFYLWRCHAFRNLIKKGDLKSFNKWMMPDKKGEGFFFHEAVYDAVALAPVHGPGTRFRKTDFLSKVEEIAARDYARSR